MAGMLLHQVTLLPKKGSKRTGGLLGWRFTQLRASSARAARPFGDSRDEDDLNVGPPLQGRESG